MSLDAGLAASLESIVSAPRLQRYRDASSSDIEMVILYCWNIKLAEALLPSLAIFEVALRNAVHTALTTKNRSEFWFKSVLHPAKYANIVDLMAKITKRQGTPPTAGKVISEITLGFWPLLFAKSYNALWWSLPNPLIADVIPNYAPVARDTRAKFEQRLEYFVALRNRVMHQEAIFQGVAALNRPILAIDVLHDQIIEAIGWINTDAQKMALGLDRFGDVYSAPGRADLEAAVRAEFKL